MAEVEGILESVSQHCNVHLCQGKFLQTAALVSACCYSTKFSISVYAQMLSQNFSYC
jgi:hypothetical protein